MCHNMELLTTHKEETETDQDALSVPSVWYSGRHWMLKATRGMHSNLLCTRRPDATLTSCGDGWCITLWHPVGSL